MKLEFNEEELAILTTTLEEAHEQGVDVDEEVYGRISLAYANYQDDSQDDDCECTEEQEEEFNSLVRKLGPILDGADALVCINVLGQMCQKIYEELEKSK